MDKNQEEKIKHSTGYIPYSYYKSDIPDEFPMVELHWHNEIELNYIIEGSGKFILGEDSVITKEGDIIIIPSKTLHAVFPWENMHHRYDTLVFDKGLLGAHFNDRSGREFLMPILNNFEFIYITKEHCLYKYLQFIVENIFSCAKGNNAKLDFLLKIELSKLFWLLDNNKDIICSSKNTDNNEIILNALEYIEGNYTEQISIEKLSGYVNLSESYFMSYLKKTVGISVMEYITRFRIKKACELLSSGNKKIADIAFESGFNNISNFNRHYKRIMECTPEEYRKKVRI